MKITIVKDETGAIVFAGKNGTNGADGAPGANGSGINAEKIRGINVAATAPTNGQVQAYNSSTSQYEPTTPAAGGGTSGGVSLSDVWAYGGF